MKKLRQALIPLGLAIVLALSILAFTGAACELEITVPNPIRSVVLSVPYTEVNQNAIFSTAGGTLTVSFYGENREPNPLVLPLTDSRIDLTAINTAIIGTQNLVATFTYTDSDNHIHTSTASVSIRVVGVRPEGDLRITRYELPLSIQNFRLRTGLAVGAATNFLNLIGDNADAPIYHVGTQNYFEFFPHIWHNEAGANEVVQGGYASTVRVYKRDINNGNQYIYLGENTEDYVDVRADQGLFQFTNNAINEHYFFRITQQIASIYDVWMHPDMAQDFFDNSIIVLDNIRVIDAYNAHNIEQFSQLDNRDDIPHANTYVNNDYWANTRTGLKINGLVLHNNLTLTIDDIPAGFFHGADRENGLVGSSRYLTLFNRINNDENTPFVFVGNYFHIDTSAVPLTDTRGAVLHGPASNIPVSQVALFQISGIAGGEVYVKNIASTGNAPRSALQRYARGLGFIRINGNVTAENIIITEHTKGVEVVSIAPRYTSLDEHRATLRYIRAFDLWREFMYAFHHDVDIHNSLIERTGGPAMVIAESWTAEAVRGPSARLFETTINNYNPARAAWFHLYGLTPTIMDFFFVDTGFLRPIQNRTIMPEDMMDEVDNEINFIAFTRIYGGTNVQLHQARATLSLDGVYLLNNAKHVPDNPFGVLHSHINPSVLDLLVSGGQMTAADRANLMALRALPHMVFANINPFLPPELEAAFGGPHPSFDFDFDVSPNHFSLYIDEPLGGGPVGAVVQLYPV